MAGLLAFILFGMFNATTIGTEVNGGQYVDFCKAASSVSGENYVYQNGECVKTPK